MLISVIGGGDNPPAEALEMAEEVGRELARHGATVVCGGLNGVMEAVCRGAKAEGGVTIGILPGSDPTEANAWVDYPICTGMGYARNVIVVKAGRAVIAVDGAYGTMSEIGHALGDGIPVIGLKTWFFSRNGAPDRAIIPAASPREAVEKALEAARRRTPQEAR
ncbi:MAG: TIGR00725 family protein [Chloroflexi bacterium]|nr:TIGR00725 family protein [Chloroflexota bacterium]